MSGTDRPDNPEPTIQELARTAGVSVEIASQVLSGSTRVSVEARLAVERAAQQLGCEAERLPKVSLARTSQCVAVVIAESTTKLFVDAFFAPLLAGISEALIELSMLMSMLTSHAVRERQLAREYLIGGHVDGVILVSLHGDDPLPGELAEANVPFVFCGRPPKRVRAGFVDCDNRSAGGIAVNHLLSLGRKTIAIISGNLDMPSAMDRLMGYRDAMAEAGFKLDPTLEEVADYQPDRAHMAMERLLLNHPDVDAVFAGSDDMAIAAMQVLQLAGKRVPEDVAVVGFDDSKQARLCRPSLSSIRQPITEMGRETVAVLMRQMANPEDAPRQVVFSAEVVIRESTAGAAAPGVLS